MLLDTSNLFPKAEKKPIKADIVICLDVTGSMQPVIDALKNNLINFVDTLQKEGQIDFRLRLIAYRDLHDTSIREGRRVCEEPWFESSFTKDVNEFSNWLSLPVIQAYGGGDEPESTLDALYRAVKSDWRENKTHRVICLMTDDDTHMTLDESTYDKPDRQEGLNRVIQELQTLKHSALYMILPRYHAYERLQEAVKDCEDGNRKVIAKYVPDDDKGLLTVDWSSFLDMLANSVSQSCI